MAAVKKSIPAIALFLAVFAPLAAEEKIPIAIMDFKVTNLQKNEVDLFTDFLSNALFETGVFDVLQRDKRDQLLKEIQFSLSDAADVNKTRQIGKLLSSKLLVFGTLGKVGRNVLVGLSLVDIETGRTAGTFSKTYKSLEEAFDDLPASSGVLAEAGGQSMFLKKANVLFYDDFETVRWLVEKGYSYNKGKYVLFSDTFVPYAWQTQIIDDFVIECDAGYVNGERNMGYGLVYRFQDEENYYVFWITASGHYCVQKKVKGEYAEIVPWTVNKIISGNSVNRLKVSAYRNRFSVYVNNLKLKEFVDATYRQGQFGVFGAQGLRVEFDEMIVYQGNLLRHDYFSKPSDHFLENEICSTKDGMYHIAAKELTNEYTTWITEKYRNISIKADVLWREGKVDAAYGITFRLQDDANRYEFFLVKSGMYQFGYLKGNTWFPLTDLKKSRLINNEGWNIMRVECIEDTYYLYLNENLVETVTDRTYRDGGVGFAAEAGMNAAFDNFELFSLEQK